MYTTKFEWKISPKLQIPRTTKRELASSFYQLKLGHGYIKSYLYRLNHTSNNKCSCGQKEIPEHLLLSCKKLELRRKELLKELKVKKVTLSLLLHTKIGIEKTLVFLKDTRIATRKWHLERLEEEEEEEEEWVSIDT